jgi:hypothetical protein
MHKSKIALSLIWRNLSITLFGTGVALSTIGIGEAALSAIVITTPDIKVTQHIRDIDLVTCIPDLLADVPALREEFINPLLTTSATAKASAACVGLKASANIEPPPMFNAASWVNFKASKEYRGYIHIPPIQVTCDAGKVVNYTNPADEHDYGYSKIPGLSGPIFDSAEVYRDPASPNFNTYAFIEGLPHFPVLSVLDQRASRLSTPERLAQFLVTSKDAPFIYLTIQLHINCLIGRIILDIERSVFPTTRLYINDKFVNEQVQANLGKFIAAGKNFPTPSGQGPLAPSGARIHWSRNIP